jgi:hypothetical protein
MNDFLNWDMNTPSNQTNPSQSTPTQDFTEFNFGTVNKQDFSTPFDNDIFSQGSSNKQTPVSEGSFWETFGEKPHQSQAHNLHTQSDMASHSIAETHGKSTPFDPFTTPQAGDQSIKSTAEQLLQLSLEPKIESEAIEGLTGEHVSTDKAITHPGDTSHTHLTQPALTPQDKPQGGSQGGNSFLELNIG